MTRDLVAWRADVSMYAGLKGNAAYRNAAKRNGMHACVDAEWLSGRMPDSRAREHRHESSYGLHIGAVDGDSLWRCYAMTTQHHCTCYFVINRDLLLLTSRGTRWGKIISVSDLELYEI